jgi:Ca-activated chloride channel family protein
MAKRLCVLLVVTVLSIVGVCDATERVVIVLDASEAMWQSFQTGVPRIVAARQALNALIASPDVMNRDLEIGLQTIGGQSDMVAESGCGDVVTLIPSAPVDPATWFGVLSELDPRGGRALVRAAEEAVETLAESEGENRILILTSGDDQCYGDIAATLERLVEADDLRIRVIGLDLDRKLSNSILLSTPTRNVSDPSLLLETLQWGLLHPETAATRPEWLELEITYDGAPLSNATVHMDDPSSDQDIEQAVEDGRARIRIRPGIHRATLQGPDLKAIELAGIVHDGVGAPVAVELSSIPDVTLAAFPERPFAGSEVTIRYWGAPIGDNRMTITFAGAPAGDFMVQAPAPGPEGEIILSIPDSPNDLEMRLTREVGAGVFQLLGRTELSSQRRHVSISAPESIEIRAPLAVSFSGSTFDGDRITIANSETDAADFTACIPVREGGPITTSAPFIPGDFVIRLVSRRGRIVDQAKIRVFEVLATLDGPDRTAANGEVIVGWTGPEGVQDYVSLAEAEAPDDEYLSWSPAADGNPSRLGVPAQPGAYELRYVRGEDGKVLARRPLEVVAIEITIEAPSVVTAGTRFDVQWAGTAGDGDFIAVAKPQTEAKDYLDWAYTSFGSPVTLAAPFEPGSYVVRFISGTKNEIIARRRIEVR